MGRRKWMGAGLGVSGAAILFLWVFLLLGGPKVRPEAPMSPESFRDAAEVEEKESTEAADIRLSKTVYKKYGTDYQYRIETETGSFRYLAQEPLPYGEKAAIEAETTHLTVWLGWERLADGYWTYFPTLDIIRQVPSPTQFQEKRDLFAYEEDLIDSAYGKYLDRQEEKTQEQQDSLRKAWAWCLSVSTAVYMLVLLGAWALKPLGKASASALLEQVRPGIVPSMQLVAVARKAEGEDLTFYDVFAAHKYEIPKMEKAVKELKKQTGYVTLREVNDGMASAGLDPVFCGRISLAAGLDTEVKIL